MAKESIIKPAWFLNTVADNNTFVIHKNNGLYRHLSYKHNGNAVGRDFEVITTPGTLLVKDGLTAHVFTGKGDLFDSFRLGTLEYNPCRFDKLITASGFGEHNYLEMDRDAIRNHLVAHLEHVAEESDFTDYEIEDHKDCLESEVMERSETMADFSEMLADFARDNDWARDIISQINLSEFQTYTINYTTCLTAVLVMVDMFDQQVASEVKL